MRIYQSLADLPAAATPVVATIGNFDGVHLGHQSVIAEVIARARQLSGQSLAITFDPHPACVLRPGQSFPLLTPLPRKLELLAATGVDATLVLPFTQALSQLSAHDFASTILRDAIHATEIHEGENFRFGHRAEAGVATAENSVTSLEALGRELGFGVHVYAPRTLRGAPISSSRIRKLIAEGNVTQARTLLGRPFDIDSTPAPGRGYGTRYAVPTINLAPYAELLPAHGVYITTLTVGTRNSDAISPAAEASGNPNASASKDPNFLVSRHPKASVSGGSALASRYPKASVSGGSALASRYPEASASGLSAQPEESGLQPLGYVFEAVTNIGNRPTFGADSFAVESHLLNFHPIDLAESTPLRLTFLRRLRAEQKFPTPEALRTQILHDVARANRYFALCTKLAK